MELRAEKISRQYHRQGRGTNIFTAVQETDLTLTGGRLVEVEGRSGSGKSTLLNMMAGILAPTGGRVLLDGQDIYALPDRELSVLRNRRIGMIPQGQTGMRALTVLENVMLPALLYPENAGADRTGSSRSGNRTKSLPEPAGDSSVREFRDEFRDLQTDLRSRAEELLEQVGIAALRDVYPDELSGGELRRMAVARALIMGAEAVLADEPTADLDDENTRTVLSLLRRCADEGRAVFLVTHEREASAYADEVYRMDQGLLRRV